MIVIKLWGGLGNQMFQYAFGYGLAQKYNEKLLFDVDFYQNQPSYVGKRTVQIFDYFKVTNFETIARPSKLNILENKYINKAIRIFPGFSCKVGNDIFFIKEHTRVYMPKLPYKEYFINYYDGYWLTSLYFQDCILEIKKEFQLQDRISGRVKDLYENLHKDSVAVHIRRGDYLNSKSLPGGYTEQTILGYYRKAIECMSNILSNPSFYFFSDDIDWCKNTFSYVEDSFFVENKGEDAAVLDLFGIALCSHGIMSPSTFGWWGNWLRNEQGIVIAPKGNYNNNHFLERGWITL